MDTQVARRSFVRRLARAILKMDDLDSFLNLLTEMVVEVFGVVWATVLLQDEASGNYIVKASSQKVRASAENLRFTRIDNVVSWLKERRRVLSRQDLEELGAQANLELRAELEETETSVSVPLSIDNELIGVLNLGPRLNKETFSSAELELLSELTEILSPIIKQAVGYRKVKEQRLHHQNILDNLVSGIIAVDPEDKITVFNRSAERILKFRAEQVLGKDVRILQANLANLLLDTLHKGKSSRREELYIMPENSLIGVSTSQFYDAKGELLGACMVFSSLVEIKKKQKLARQQNLDSYWSNLATSLAHEVKNSIVATKVFTEMFPQKYEDAEYRWNLYSNLKRDMDKLDSFTEKVMNFAQPEPLSIQPCQMDKVLDAAINSALENKDIGKITFEKRYSQNLQALSGDYHQLKEAFGHLICNALEAMDKKGRLSISVEQERSPADLIYNLPEAIEELPQGSIIVIKITDTGCGILPQNMPRVFDPFFTTKEARSGLGLAFARKIIERHRGIIKAQSKPGQGSTFWVCLPVSSELS